MSRKESDFLKRLLVTFQGEAEERVRSLASGLIELEKATEPAKQAEMIELVFREVHSLKGAARSVNLMEIEAICQAMEDVFAALKRQKIAISLPLLDLLHQATDVLKGLLAAGAVEQGSGERSQHMPLIRQLKEMSKANPVSTSNTAPALLSRLEPAPSSPVAAEDTERPNVAEIEVQPAQSAEDSASDWHDEIATKPQPALRPLPGEKPLPAETVRISTDRLESLLLQVEELVSAKLAVSQRAAELREPRLMLDEWDKRWNKFYPTIRTLSHLLDSPDKGQDRPSEWEKLKDPIKSLLEFLEWNQNWAESLDVKVSAIANSAERDQRAIAGMVDHLLQDMKQVLMLPFSSILEVFPSTARDLARQQDKEVQLVLHGAEIEVDRRILQEIKDALMHLVRNSIDHGLEKPSVREANNKPRRGTVTITVAQKDSSKFEVVIADDGSGIDLDKVRTTATRLGMIAPESAQQMGKQEVESLIFQSGFSTSPLITDISGRGLGLAIVQEKIEKLGGTLTLETEAGKGTTFRLLLPLTLATLRGLLVRCEGHSLILPILYVERVARASSTEIQTVQNRETIRIGEQTLSLVRLGQALELPVKSATHDPTGRILVVILATAEKRIAFLVDEIIGEQEVLMKGLGAQLARVRNIAGATVLGTGQVIPIINVPDLIKSAIKTIDNAVTIAEQSPSQDKNILIVEDSITARMQLKNILELSGYTVKTAVDGLDALMTLRAGPFDLVVSDVDMPRLNGLDLTSRIRNDKTLSELPVVLVTTLASREDQERGVEAGANAYITKSNFDQNKLLDAIRRLI